MESRLVLAGWREASLQMYPLSCGHTASGLNLHCYDNDNDNDNNNYYNHHRWGHGHMPGWLLADRRGRNVH
jgi:hypothetical protein